MYVVLPLALITIILPASVWRFPLLTRLREFLGGFLGSKPYSYLPLPAALQFGGEYPEMSLGELYETYPNGIVNSLRSFNKTAFSEGGKLRLSRGTWFMVLVTEEVKLSIPDARALERIGVTPAVFKGLSTGSYDDFNEIYFFAYDGRSLGSMSMMTELLLEASSGQSNDKTFA